MVQPSGESQSSAAGRGAQHGIKTSERPGQGKVLPSDATKQALARERLHGIQWAIQLGNTTVSTT